MFTLKIVNSKTQLVSFVELDDFEIISQSAAKDLFDQLTSHFLCDKTRYNTAVVIVGSNGSENVTKYLDKDTVAFVMNSQGKTIEYIKGIDHIINK